MAFSSSNFDLILALRLLQTVLSLLVLILSSTTIAFFNTHVGVGSPPASLVFQTFTAVFTLLLALPYNTFAARYFSAYTNRYTSMAVELLITLFWFAGWIAVAVYLGSIRVCRGSVCGAAKAAVALAAINWLLFCCSSWMPVYYTFFDEEHARGRGLGAGNSRLGMSGAVRISSARLRKEAANNERVRAEREGEKTGVWADLARGVKRVAGTGKVRIGNVLDEWKEKAGRGAEAEDRRSEMSVDVERAQNRP